MKTTVILAGLLVLAACQPQETSKPATEFTRPTYELATTEAYDFTAIQPYAADHDAVYDYIDTHLERHVSALQRWVRQPSISAKDVGIQEMAEMLRQDLSDLGFAEAELVPTDGHPGVWGYYLGLLRCRRRENARSLPDVRRAAREPGRLGQPAI
jgi:hypothetical protein